MIIRKSTYLGISIISAVLSYALLFWPKIQDIWDLSFKPLNLILGITFAVLSITFIVFMMDQRISDA